MLPIGVTTFELTFGQTFDYEGVSLQTDLTIVPSHEVRTAAGERIVPALIETSSPVGEYGSIDLPQPGQGNLYDLKGNLITNWWYTVTAVDSKAGRTVGDTKVWKLQPTIDQLVVDLDTQPTDQVVGPVGSVVPPAVTSVNGGTGAVTVEGVTGAVVRGVIVETGEEPRPAGADVVVWVDPDNLGAVNALTTDPVIAYGGDASKLDVSAAPELIRDTIGTALTAGTNITIVVNDAGDTITINSTGGGGGITTEEAVDAVAAALATPGAGMDVTYNDGANTLTLAVKANVARAVIVATGSEARPTADVVVWIDPLQVGATNALATDMVVSPGESSTVTDIINAKGDLLVGSGADALSRLGVGTDGQALLADSGQTLGIKWGAAGGSVVDHLPKRKNSWYTTTHPISGTPGAAAGSFGTSGQRVFLIPFEVTATAPFDKIGGEIFAAAASGKVMRYGVYSGDPDMTTLTKIASTSVVIDTTGTKQPSIGPVTLTPGMYWLAQGTNDTTNLVSVKRAAKLQSYPGAGGGGDPWYYATEWAIQMDSVNLASDLPSTFTISSAAFVDNDVPICWLHRAA